MSEVLHLTRSLGVPGSSSLFPTLYQPHDQDAHRSGYQEQSRKFNGETKFDFFLYVCNSCSFIYNVYTRWNSQYTIVCTHHIF